MAKKIKLGTTKLEELHEVLDLPEEILETKKSRLFPIGNTEQERATVSIFLASLSAVKEYREELFVSLNIKKITNNNVNIHTYVEIQGGNENDRPDGLIVITSGKNTPIIEWIGFVEAKIGENILCDNQIERYIDFANEIGIKDIITISNYLVTTPFDTPITTKKRSFNLFHWSWEYLRVIASRLIKNNAVADEDHIYMLNELQIYLTSHRNLRGFINMGSEWKDSVNTIQGYNKEQKIKQDILDAIIDPIIQEEKDISLRLTDTTGYLVELMFKNDRKSEVIEMLQNEKIITSQYSLNGDKKNTFCISIDFIRQEIQCYKEVLIDKGQAKSQTTQLIKMLEQNGGYSENIFINAIYNRNKSIEKDTVTLADLIIEKNKGVPFYSNLNKDFGDTVKYFEIKTKDQLGKRFQGTKTFIDDIEGFSERFIEQVMMNLK